ncbi:MAG: type II toxin-antitoxin system HicB family antitoxin [Snodgrassella sp.]|uniref:type II toxin-antitoxin system HicB family antitoxin n=1 Tax=unclassified Lactobacillus TaxID=2620435 RepID=UPI000EFD538D|nr:MULTISPECIES: type II toxin-antitoxin system HicB family antitoxin [unclassified Lactobacillus]MCO6514932.1 type II toxin-antitoxin system HicB family antitoxin [Snodgrassella sp.]RMC35987.1 HicB family protein [Lactobacillus sp. ESL0237]RMC42458.1 HicB family protein [Lactobacillus sp. ESL0234]RMC43134.1 HicB family protein [Lactobacillus sp. ESL0236]RMC50838.1 HicB family protein [Lactobacillus sp. ESL0225]
MEKVLVYPVVLHPEEKGYTVEIPDIEGGWTQGEDMKEALMMAADLIGLALEDKTEYPLASDLDAIKTDKDDIKTIVSVDMDEYRRKNPKTIRKNVSVPEYLVKLGKEQHVNFSALLTEALKAKLEV